MQALCYFLSKDAILDAMGKTPDRRPGPSIEEAIDLEDQTTDPTVTYRFQRNAEKLRYKNTNGVWTILDEEQHRLERQLIHFIDNGPAEGFASNAYRETLPAANPFPTSVIWWESAAKLKKIVEKTIAYTGSFPTTITWRVYAADGVTVVATVSDAITLSGPFELSRTRTIS